MKLISLLLLVSTVAAAQPGSKKIAAAKDASRNVLLGFVSPDIRFKKDDHHAEPAVSSSWTTTGWRGEKVHTQIMIKAAENLTGITLKTETMSSRNGQHIAASNIKASFIGYVTTDGLNKDGGGCGIPANLDTSMVADVISTKKKIPLKAGQIQPVWLSIHIPQQTAAGLYHGQVKLYKNGIPLAALGFTVTVNPGILPPPKEWKFALDLWQNPYSVARMYHVKPWSDAHFKLMRPYMKMLAAAGQKAITTTIITDPWNGQTYDKYQSMVSWVKKKNGTWTYDYHIFDQWVSFMISCGIDKEISCYSLIPWDLKYHYYDERTAKDTCLIAAPGSKAYEQHWKPMLIDFASHLKKKGWFGRTMIAMDERPLEAMQFTIKVIKNADPQFKVFLAGNYHPEIEDDIADYSVASNQVVSKEKLESRRKRGYQTTYYTCCTEGTPNTFTFSAPAESAWIAWYAENKGFDGYLRWAYNCWNKNPLKDSRFGTWSAGDSFFVYPGNSSSIRFERLIEGIQDAEKVRLLQQEFLQRGQKENIALLQAAVKDFELTALKTRPAAEMVNNARKVLNSFGQPEKSTAVKPGRHHVYYVSVTGNNKEKGSLQFPLQSINYALSLAHGGDTVILRSGSYTEKVQFPNSGSKDQYITLKAYAGEKPVIDGSGMTVSKEESLVLVSGVSWIAVEGLEVCNFKTALPNTVVNGICVNNGANFIKISNNKIHHIENTMEEKIERSAHAILVIGNTSSAVRHIVVEGNKVSDCKTGYSENITINGYVDGFLIKGNSVSRGENIGIVAAGGYRANQVQALNYARNGIISNNEVFDIDDSHGAPGIYVDGARNITVERNNVHHVFRGIGVLSENTGYPTENCVVRYNNIYENDCAGIYLGGYEGQQGGGGTNNCEIIHNTLSYNNRKLGYGKEVEGEIRMKMGCNDNAIQYNVIYARADRGLFVNKVNTDGNHNQFDHNSYFSKGKSSWTWDGKSYTNFAAWQGACNGDRESINN